MKKIDDILKSFINDETKELMWGIDTVMTSLTDNQLYELYMAGGNFVITNWPDKETSPPTNEQIKREYQRQETIVEFYNYLKNDQPEIFDALMNKLGHN